MDYKKELQNIEEQINEKKIEKAKYEERKKQLEEEKKEILDELSKQEIEVDKLEEIIAGLEVDIQTGIEKCKKILES